MALKSKGRGRKDPILSGAENEDLWPRANGKSRDKRKRDVKRSKRK